MNRLRRARLDADKSQLQLMKETGIYYATISRLERGWLKPTDAQRVALAEALGVDPEWLFPDDDES